jgi:hypothetical protein
LPGRSVCVTSIAQNSILVQPIHDIFNIVNDIAAIAPISIAISDR